MRQCSLNRSAQQLLRENRVTVLLLRCAALLIFSLSVDVRPAAADMTDKSTMAGGLLSSLTQCIIDCATNSPPEEYTKCVETCYADATNSTDGGSCGSPEWTLKPKLVRSGTDLGVTAGIGDRSNCRAPQSSAPARAYDISPAAMTSCATQDERAKGIRSKDLRDVGDVVLESGLRLLSPATAHVTSRGTLLFSGCFGMDR